MSKIEWTDMAKWGTVQRMGSKQGSLKAAAARIGLTPETYFERLAAGHKWCHVCCQFLDSDVFGVDKSRGDGLTAACRPCRRSRARARYEPRPKVIRRGRRFVAPRDGDKKQARRRVNHLADEGLLPHPSTQPCTDCGDTSCARRHEFDHFMGYAAEHHEDVEVVCSKCHHAREVVRD